MHETHLDKGFYESPENTEELAAAEKLKNEKLKEEIDQEIQRLVERLLLDQRQFLGKGQSAEAHFLPDNKKICFKITTHREALGKNIPEPTIPVTVQNADHIPPHSPKKEGEYLAELQSIKGPVKVPRPFEWAMYEDHDDGDTYDVREKMEILAMETIDGVSMSDVFDGTQSLPESFEIERFFKELREFIQKMHEKMIFHRDLHAGNVMIQKETGSAAVIDFGHAGDDENEDSVVEKRVGKTLGHYRRIKKDVDWVDSLEAQMRKHLTQTK